MPTIWDEYTAPELLSKIKQIDEILLSGAASTTVDGITTAIDRESLRAERKRLIEVYERKFGRRTKPTVATIDLRGA